MATKKMFVKYNGTVSSFKTTNYANDYANSIIFITGDANGNDAAIYAKGNYYTSASDVQAAVNALKYFSKVSDGTNVASAANKEGTLTFSADDPASVAVKVDSTGVHFALTEAFKTSVNTTLPNRIKANEDAISSIQDELESLSGGAGSIATQINNAIAALDLPNTYEAKGEAAKAEAAAKSYADGLATNYDAKGDAAQALVDAKAYVDGKVDGKFDAAGTAAGLNSAMDTRVKVLEAIDHNKIATDAAAAAVAGVIDDAPEAFDTLKEVATWIASNDHASDVATLMSDVENLKKIDHNAYVAADEVVLTSAKSYTTDEIAKLSFDAAGTAETKANAALTEAKSYVDGKVNGKFDAAGSAAAAEAAAKADAAAAQSTANEALGKANAAAPQSTTYTKTEVDSMWDWEEL
jgi:hypothetical protein